MESMIKRLRCSDRSSRTINIQRAESKKDSQRREEGVRLNLQSESASHSLNITAGQLSVALYPRIAHLLLLRVVTSSSRLHFDKLR
jgi:hypothetical protein